MADTAHAATPRRVFLFSGHMIDAPGRERPRFPADKEPIAAAAIAAKLAELGASAGDRGVSGAACGGDLLFAEAALRRALALEIYLPLREPEFLTTSVDFADADWHRRYFAVTRHPAASMLIAPELLGPVQNADPYERTNLWMLEAASRWGAERVHFICLWNGEGGDGPGGTRHMRDEVVKRNGSVHWLDTTKLWS
jgi:hypothetical protein